MRRAATETRILQAAREQFSELGFDRTTIRGIAGRAKVDPALVMQYFGSKDALFEKAASLPLEGLEELWPDDLMNLLLSILGIRMAGLPLESIALMRSMLTHPDTAARVGERVAAYVEGIAKAIPGEDAELRAALIVSIIRGVTIDRHLLQYAPIRDASPERITRLLQPCLEALARPAGTKKKKKPKS